MQTLSRQLNRNNTVIIISAITKTPEFIKRPRHNELYNLWLTKRKESFLQDGYRDAVQKKAKKYQDEVNEKRLRGVK